MGSGGELVVENAKKKRKNREKERKKELGISKKELDEASRLHSLLFGSLGDVADSLGKELDKGEAKDLRSDLLPGGLEQQQDEEEKKPAWEDEDEVKIKVRLPEKGELKALKKTKAEEVVSGREYRSRVRALFSKLNPGTADWAELPSVKKKKKRKQQREGEEDSDFSEDDEYGDDILRTNDELVVRSKSRLPETVVEITRVRDANAEEPSSAVIRSVQFHRNAQILLTAGFDKKLRFFQIDGKRNPKLQTVFLDDFPIQKAQFTSDGSKAVVSARRKVFIVYDVVHGKAERSKPLTGREEKSLESFELSPDGKHAAFMGNEGYILFTSLDTMQLVFSLKMNGSVRSLGFSSDGLQLMSCGGDGEVYRWDLRTRRCIGKAVDEGCVHNTALAVSPTDEYLATGGDTGVVNLYKKDDFFNRSKPLRSLMNLTTAVDNLKFNHDAQILAMASRLKRNALKLVHLPSCTVFANWPTDRSPLGFVNSLDFSPGGGYLAAGNAVGKVLLYRVRHYDHA